MAKFAEIKHFLDKQGIEFEVIDLPGRAVSVEDVVRLSGGKVHREEIVKTLIVKTKQGNFMVCPILAGLPIVIDKKVTNLKRVNMGSGDHLRGLEMDFVDLLKVLSDYTVEEISL